MAFAYTPSGILNYITEEMNSPVRMVLVPLEAVKRSNTEIRDSNTDTNMSNILNKPKKPDLFLDKLTKVLRIALKLASISAYNDDGYIRNANGTYLTDTYVLKLIGNAVSKGKVLHGENEFITLLKEANVPLDWITNENVKKKLQLIGNQMITVDPFILKNRPQLLNKAARKRKYIEDADCEASNPELEEREVLVPRKKRKMFSINCEEPDWKRSLD